MTTSSISQASSQPVQPSVLAFLLRAGAWIVGLFAFVRIPWVQDRLLIPFAQLQHGAACALTGAPRDAVVVDLSCTGADVMAVTLGALLSFPMPWKRRFLGAGLGLGLLVGLNTVRIGVLSWVVGDRDLFQLLHLRLLPMLLVLAATAFVLYWIRRPAAGDITTAIPRDVLRPLGWVLGFTLVYFLLAPSLYSSDLVLRLATWITAGSAKLMHWLGVEVAIRGNVLVTNNRSWLVTQECVLTPLIPAYLGLAWALLPTLRAKLLATLAALPLFSLLGACRLMVLALPASVVGEEHFVAVHAFYQVLLAVAAIVGLHWLRDRNGLAAYLTPTWSALFGLGAGVLLQAIDRGRVLATSELVNGQLVNGQLVKGGLATADPQGVLTFAPAFMLGLFVAATLIVGGRSMRWSAGAGFVLVVIGIGLRWGIGALGETGFAPHPLLLRAVALTLPLLAAWLLRRRRSPSGYLEQWNQVGEWFPDLGGAGSTATYRRDEQSLLRQAFPTFRGVRLFKTDLWDEARNSRILQWAAAEGASVAGIDISLPTVLLARDEFRRLGVQGALVVADVRSVPFRNHTFDGAYSMGTVEHFDETQQAVGEIARVTNAGGRVVLGVPNRWDPFLRPVLVGWLQAFGRYDYGAEMSYSHRSLGRLCTQSGLQIEAQSGILFQPGFLRMLDLALHTGTWNLPLLRPLVAAALKPFSALSAASPWLLRHGYLIAAIARPEDGA